MIDALVLRADQRGPLSKASCDGLSMPAGLEQRKSQNIDMHTLAGMPAKPRIPEPYVLPVNAPSDFTDLIWTTNDAGNIVANANNAYLHILTQPSTAECFAFDVV